MHTKSELRELLSTHHLRLKKRFGQHYLVDPHLTRRMIEACDLAAADTVIEIGAGLGALTPGLAERVARVLALEVDPVICQALRTRLADHRNVTVVCQNVLAFDWSTAAGAKVVGAIPYHITSPILLTLSERPTGLSGVWLGMQREVADRLTAPPGTKAYGRLSILMQYRWHMTQLFRIPRTAFFPMPEVESAWVELLPRTAPAVSVRDESLFFEVVRVAFGQRRKMLLNCLQELADPRLNREAAVRVLERMGFPAGIRGEMLSLEAFGTFGCL